MLIVGAIFSFESVIEYRLFYCLVLSFCKLKDKLKHRNNSLTHRNASISDSFIAMALVHAQGRLVIKKDGKNLNNLIIFFHNAVFTGTTISLVNEHTKHARLWLVSCLIY